MPGMLRPIKTATKIAYKILKTPKDMQQHNDKKPNPRRIYSWYRDSIAGQ